MLTVPANQPDRIAKALASEADEVVIDLEDAVGPEDKESARQVLRSLEWSNLTLRTRVTVRVNAPRTAWCHRDLEVAVALDQVSAVVIPKVESSGDLDFVDRLLDGLEAESGIPRRIRTQALIETAAGVDKISTIVDGAERLECCIIGYADLAASLGRSSFPHAGWLPIQERILVACRAAGLEAVDGPWLAVADDYEFRDAVGAAAAIGFDGKWVIHPRQIDTVNRAFTPTVGSIKRAHKILNALAVGHESGQGAVNVDGQLVDEAMAVDARRILARAALSES